MRKTLYFCDICGFGIKKEEEKNRVDTRLYKLEIVCKECAIGVDDRIEAYVKEKNNGKGIPNFTVKEE